MKKAVRFVEQLAALSFDNVFNPYSDACPAHDLKDAASIRRRNLVAMIDAALALAADTIWFGRDLGYRGGRRTGLALTDEAHLDTLRVTFRIAEVKQATATAPVAERTAREIWKMIQQMSDPPFLWNVFPFHPHEPRDPMTNRCHSVREARACEDVLVELLGLFRPTSLVALGKDAQKALARLGYDCVCIRHPSYGGQAEFVSGMRAHYSLPRVQSRLI